MLFHKFVQPMSLVMVMLPIVGNNPFFSAYVNSDFFGKLIFIAIFFLSVLSWVVLLHKLWFAMSAAKLSKGFSEQFRREKNNALGMDSTAKPEGEVPNCFLELYCIMKQQTLECLNKNRLFAKESGRDSKRVFLSSADLELVESYLQIGISEQVMHLQKNLFVLPTTISLAPFLGLLGTVWGILLTFGEMQSGGQGSQMVLHGLSMALATTVLGLLVAIPPIVGYNYLRSQLASFTTDMENFASEMLTTVEMHYRPVDVQ